jgi:threonine/homoserine/homoserine lactone efflux protein
MTVTNLLVFALALVVAAGSPGTSIAALVARVLTNGLRDVLPFLAAMWLGEALWLTCAVAGLAVVARTLGVVFVAIKFIGVAYLLYLAWKVWFAPTQVSKDNLPAGQSPWRLFGTGLAVYAGKPEDHDVLSRAAAHHRRFGPRRHGCLDRADRCDAPRAHVG